MDAARYDQILKSVESPTERGLGGLLAGPSAEMAALKSQITVLAGAPRDEKRPVCVVVARHSRCRPFDEEVAALFPTPPDLPLWMDIHPHSPMFNSATLFGMALKCGVFEQASGRPVILRDCDFLEPGIIDRLIMHFRIWRSAARPPNRYTPAVDLIIFTGGNNANHTYDAIREFATLHCLEVPRLVHRHDDIPFCIHESARRFARGLADFAPDAVDTLLHHTWPGDVQEVYEFCRYLFIPSSASAAAVTAIQVKASIEYARITPSGRADIVTGRTAADLWLDVTQLCDECDRHSTQMTGLPFFATGTVITAMNPLIADWPELAYVRLVSWAFQKCVEAGSPNIPIVVKIGDAVSRSAALAKQMLERISRLRTFEQHRLEYGSDTDRKTREVVYDWLRAVCGSGTPGPEHFERCTVALLSDLKAFLAIIVDILKAIDRDPFRELLLQQWLEQRDQHWPKHMFDGLVVEVLKALNRSDLKSDVVSSALLSECQVQLSVVSDTAARRKHLQNWLEKCVTERYPMQMPIGGEDIKQLGVVDGRQMGEILRAIRAEFTANGGSREALLEKARVLVARPRQDTRESTGGERRSASAQLPPPEGNIG